MKRVSTYLFLIFVSLNVVVAKHYYVAMNGSDNNSGTKEHPFRTIQKAADIMQAGDVCIVREGIYREWIKPVRGGISESRRIVYKAAPGERAVIKGSEQITTWVKHNDHVWKVELPDSFFGSFNPFKTNISGGWIKYGRQYHLGDVYRNGKSYREIMSLDTVALLRETFFIEAGQTTTRLYANFGNEDPNQELTEINVRECVFFPEVKGLRYITVDGFTMMHAAANWTCFRAFQRALIGTYYGRHWVIENCRISDARCTAIVCGNDPSREDEGFDIDSVGHHIVRNNVIRNCGQAGIHGFKGWAASIIEGNLIENISSKKEFGGYETGGIKLHDAVDVVIRNNIVRKVYVGGPGQYAGIWIDWGAQGTRVTGNIVYDMEASALFLQNAHGAPLLVDNNIFSGEIRSSMESCVYVHNMFINCTWNYRYEKYSPVYWKPHSAIRVDTLLLRFQNDKNYNNIYMIQGADGVPNHPGFMLNWNVYYEGARKSPFDDVNSILDSTFHAEAAFRSLADGVVLTFLTNKAPYTVHCPLITYDLVGTFKLTGQGLEDHEGTPLSVDHDMLGAVRNRQSPTAGPIENLRPGRNTIQRVVNPR